MIVAWNPHSAKELGVPLCERFASTIVDSEGRDYRHLRVTWLNTDTGEIEYFQEADDGMVEIDPKTEDLIRRKTTLRAPLTIHWRDLPH